MAKHPGLPAIVLSSPSTVCHTELDSVLTCGGHFFVSSGDEEVHGTAGVRPFEVSACELSLMIADSVLQSPFVELEGRKEGKREGVSE
jgi:hypothetical protein